MYLVDTNVLLAGAPTRAVAVPAPAAWMERNSAGLSLSVITVVEVGDGIARSRRQGARQKAARLAAWLETLLHLCVSRVLPVDLPTARRSGGLADQARGQGQAPGLADLVAIAATAQATGYTILTRSLRHVVMLGVAVLDPFEALPDAVRCLCNPPLCPASAGGPMITRRSLAIT